jgi:ComF family protein
MTSHMARAALQAKQFSVRAGRALLNFVYPPSCPVSDAPVDEPGLIAPEAWSRLRFVTDPQCVRCGLPFEFDPGEGLDCAACSADPPVVDRARAALVYDDVSRRLILELKHVARTDALPTFGAWMALAAGESLADADLVIPIPLHARRLRARRFNQSGLLARALAARSGKPLDVDALLRARATPSQAGKSASGRARNVAGAFAVREGAEARLSRASILLVDDVRTTGATLDAAARALKKAGAARVDAVTLLRVVRPRDILR